MNFNTLVKSAAVVLSFVLTGIAFGINFSVWEFNIFLWVLGASWMFFGFCVSILNFSELPTDTQKRNLRPKNKCVSNTKLWQGIYYLAVINIIHKQYIGPFLLVVGIFILVSAVIKVMYNVLF